MSVPEDFSILNITGTFVMNKTLSDSTDEILRLQGVSWITRNAIYYGTITLKIKHYKDDEGNEHIDIDQTLSPGGISGTTEARTLIWQEHHNEDHVFGAVVAKSRRVKVEDIDDIDFLKTGWTEDTLEAGVIQAHAVSDTPKSGTTWIANQTWGIQIVDGVRRYARHLHFIGPGGEDIQAKIFYDYAGTN